MGKVLGLMDGLAEPGLVVRRNGQVSAWEWRGQLYRAGALLAAWADPEGRQWQRAVTPAGELFLLCRASEAWWIMPWPGQNHPRRSGAGAASSRSSAVSASCRTAASASRSSRSARARAAAGAASGTARPSLPSAQAAAPRSTGR